MHGFRFLLLEPFTVYIFAAWWSSGHCRHYFVMMIDLSWLETG
jgi:hypothetical protein